MGENGEILTLEALFVAEIHFRRIWKYEHRVRIKAAALFRPVRENST